MKKKIILFLSFLMVAMCLTGCGRAECITKITSEEISKITQVAENIKNNPAYELPEGYTFKLEDNSKNGRIIINAKSETNKPETIIATFDISKDEVQLIEIGETYEYRYGNSIFAAIWLGVILGCIVGIVAMITSNKEKMKNL